MIFTLPHRHPSPNREFHNVNWQILWCGSQCKLGKYKRPLTSRDFISLWKEKRYKRNIMFLFAEHYDGLLNNNHVQQIIFVYTVFLLFTLRMPCERTLIHAQSTLWTAPQNLQFTLWNSGYRRNAYRVIDKMYKSIGIPKITWWQLFLINLNRAK